MTNQYMVAVIPKIEYYDKLRCVVILVMAKSSTDAKAIAIKLHPELFHKEHVGYRKLAAFRYGLEQPIILV